MPCFANYTTERELLVEGFGYAGAVAAWLLFLSPVPTMLKIRRRGYIGDFSAMTALTSSLQCCLWTVYALPMYKNAMPPLITNSVGAVIQISCARRLTPHLFSCMRSHLFIYY